jgi:quercetin dioxygenase-like cupin family protein/heme-degrading monooxygenase HmoA
MMPHKISQKPTIFRPLELSSVDRGNGARTIPFVTARTGSQKFLNGMTIFNPGAAIAHHTHNVAESVMVVAGNAIVNIDGHEHLLSTFDTTYVPANIPHHFRNASTEQEMRIFWTYGSIDSTRTIVETGLTSRITEEQQLGSIQPIVELAIIRIHQGKGVEFEQAVRKAIPIFQAATGSRSMELESSIEDPTCYFLRIGWDTIEDHTQGFRSSSGFTLWRELVGEFFASAPEIWHLRNSITGF